MEKIIKGGETGTRIVVYIDKPTRYVGVYDIGATTIGYNNEDWNYKIVYYHFKHSLEKYMNKKEINEKLISGINTVSVDYIGDYKIALKIYRTLKVLVKKFG